MIAIDWLMKRMRLLDIGLDMRKLLLLVALGNQIFALPLEENLYPRRATGRSQ